MHRGERSRTSNCKSSYDSMISRCRCHCHIILRFWAVWGELWASVQKKLFINLIPLIMRAYMMNLMSMR